MKTLRTYSSRETADFGASLAKKILNTSDKIPMKHGALVFALQGDLGAGKTTFTQGFGAGLGITRRMISPTFIIMRRFAIPASGQKMLSGKKAKARFRRLYHIDAYRLKKADGLDALGFKAILHDPQNIVLIEWPEKIKKILPKDAVWLKFRHEKNETERKVTMKQ